MKEIEAVIYSIAKANEFIEKAIELREYLEDKESFTYASKIRSSARRASMDLTRALAEFRKPK